jgi:nucleotide-binding universal stress UspA family protein
LLGYSLHREEDAETDRAFGQILQQVMKVYRGHLVVAHFGEPRELRRVLAPVSAEVNLELFGQLLRGLLRGAERDVTLAQIVPDPADTDAHHAAAAFLRQVAERCGLLGSVDLRVESSGDVAEGILAMSWEYDAVVVGLTRSRSLSERLLGSISDQVATWARCTTFLLRAGC